MRHALRLAPTALAAAVAALALVAACGAGSSRDPNATTICRGTDRVNGSRLANTAVAACHGPNGEGGTGPAWIGLFGSEVELKDGSVVVADEAYLRRSIVDPNGEIPANVVQRDAGERPAATLEAIDALVEVHQERSSISPRTLRAANAGGRVASASRQVPSALVAPTSDAYKGGQVGPWAMVGHQRGPARCPAPRRRYVAHLHQGIPAAHRNSFRHRAAVGRVGEGSDQQHPPAMDALLGVVHGDAEPVGDLGVCPRQRVVQHHRTAVGERQAQQGVLHGFGFGHLGGHLPQPDDGRERHASGSTSSTSRRAPAASDARRSPGSTGSGAATSSGWPRRGTRPAPAPPG